MSQKDVKKGMTIIQELVELMGGYIQVESTLGRGTRVEVSLMLNKVRDVRQSG